MTSVFSAISDVACAIPARVQSAWHTATGGFRSEKSSGITTPSVSGAFPSSSPTNQGDQSTFWKAQTPPETAQPTLSVHNSQPICASRTATHPTAAPSAPPMTCLQNSEANIPHRLSFNGRTGSFKVPPKGHRSRGGHRSENSSDDDEDVKEGYEQSSQQPRFFDWISEEGPRKGGSDYGFEEDGLGPLPKLHVLNDGLSDDFVPLPTPDQLKRYEAAISERPTKGEDPEITARLYKDAGFEI